MDLATLLRERTTAKAGLTRTLNSIKKELASDHPFPETIESKMNSLNGKWENVQTKHDMYMYILEAETGNGEDEESVKWIEEIQDEFDKIEKIVAVYLKDCKDNTQTEKEGERRILSLRLREQEIIQFRTIADVLRVLIDTPVDNGTITAMKDALCRFDDCMRACTTSNEKAIKEGYEVTAKDDTYKQTLTEYNQLRNNCQLLIGRQGQSGQGAKPVSVNTFNANTNIRLQKLSFEIFSGDVRMYPRFHDDFKKHIKPLYGENDEAFVLRSYLSSDVKEEIYNLGDDIDSIWKRLNTKYGDEGKLVDLIMADIKKLKRTNDNPSDILKMINVIEKAERDLVLIGRGREISNSTIVSMIEERLPVDIENEWIKLVTGKNREEMSRDKFPHLLKLLLEIKQRIEYKDAEIRKGESKGKSHLTRTEERDGDRRPPWCWIHPDKNDHPIWRCKTFIEKSSEERYQLVRDNHACYACLQKGHYSKDCQLGFTCRENGCSLSHHKLLHDAHVSGLSFHNGKITNNENDVLLQLQNINGHNGIRGGKKLSILWDSGSTLSFITLRKAKELGLKGRPTKLQIAKVGGDIEDMDTFEYTLYLRDKYQKHVRINVLGIERISTDIEGGDVSNITRELMLKDDDIDRPSEGEIDCLIGVDYAAYHPYPVKVVNHLILYENRFGKVIGGRLESKNEELRKNSPQMVTHVKMNLKQFYSIEDLGVECKDPKCGGCKCGRCHPGGRNMTLKEEEEYKIIEDNLSYLPEEKKWEAAYPWKRNPNELPNNRQAVLGALKSTERRLKHSEAAAENYKAQIDDMKKRNVCRKLSAEELRKYNGPIFYIAHHEVYNNSSKSTPVRIVFNSSANFRGHILNDYFFKGPDLLNNLLGVLLRFREGHFAMIGDVKKMFHSIKIPILEQMTHRFLWRDLDESKSPDEYVMTAVNFGDRPSGTIAIMALQKTAEMGKEISPNAAESILKNSYMDDIIESVDSEWQMNQRIIDIEKILELGGFQIKEWNTSSQKKEEDEVSIMSSAIEGSDTEKVLGMRWDPKADKFSFKMKLNFTKKSRKAHEGPDLTKDDIPWKIPAKLTKRVVLSQVNSIYDPIGLLSPFTVRAKILMRKLWACDVRLDWDDEISEENRKEWETFFSEMFKVENLKFPRSIKPMNPKGKPSLIIFSDASTNAYGATAYARWETNDEGVVVKLIASKNRIAPIRIVDIVRLELCGAVLSKRLRVFIQEEMRLEFGDVFHIVDSEIIKAMISKGSYGFNTFTANRVGEIQGSTRKDEWYWTAGKLNIADWITRGKQPSEIDSESEWQNGPNFLKGPVAEWPIEKSTEVDELPERIKSVHHVTDLPRETLASRINIDRFSKYELLINTTARLLGLYERFKKQNEKTEDNNSIDLSVRTRKKAKRLWTIDAQKSIMKDLKEKKMLKLVPRIKEGIIEVGGRAERWMGFNWNTQSFIVLPANHRYSQLLALHEHEKGGHKGVSATISQIRSKYWIIGIRNLVRKLVSRCRKCKEKLEMNAEQVMANLPIERLKPCPPFTNTGVDYFGPFLIKGEVQKRVRSKCYGVIFACMVSRAVHIDISQNYSTDAFLQVLRRFSSLRGWPHTFYSDNGSQLVSASKELRQAISGLDRKTLQEYTVNHDTEWRFSPADAPWYNGHVEALVKSVKTCLNSTVGDHIFPFSELQTIFYEVAQIVNQRPIGLHPSSPEDGTYLCPNDLLLGRASSEVPQGPFLSRVSDKHRFDHLQGIVEEYWRKWSRDVFPNLFIQQKWHVEQRNVSVGDIVLIQDANLFRGQWKLGRVTEAIPSSDGRVRRVKVVYKYFNDKEKGTPDYKGTFDTEIERPIQRLIVLLPNEQTS